MIVCEYGHLPAKTGPMGRTTSEEVTLGTRKTAIVAASYAALSVDARQLELIPGLTIVDVVPSTDAQALTGLATIAHWTAERLQHFARTRSTLGKEGNPTPDDLAQARAEIRIAAHELLSLTDTFLARLAAGREGVR
jgi:hypothetical protein